MGTNEKQHRLISIFLNLSLEEKYEKIITMGRALPILPPSARSEKNLVRGCQSLLYLDTELRGDLIYFNADSEALISKGLAALLIEVYSGESPEALFKEPPFFLKEIGLHQALSPARSNGLASLFKKMQEEAFLMVQALNNG